MALKNKNKYYRTVIQMEVLSQEPIGDASMQTILNNTDMGDWSGLNKTIVQDEELDGKQAATLLKAQGSDPDFFMLNDEGEELSEE